MKRKVVYKCKFRANLFVDKDNVIADAKKAKEIHLLEEGKMSDGTEYVVVKILV